MNNLTPDEQKISEELVKLVMQRVYTKIAPMLTDEDISKIEDLDSKDESGNSVRNFLISKVPNFDTMFQEEVNLLKNQLPHLREP